MTSGVRSASLLISGRALGTAASLLIPIVLARAFSPSVFGTYKQLFLIYGTLYGVAQLGVAESLFFFLPRDPGDAGRHAANSMLVLSGAGLACLAGLWILRGWIAARFGNADLRQSLPALGFFLLLMLATAGLEIVMTARGHYAGAAGAYALTDLVRTAFFILPVMRGFGLQGLLAGAAFVGLLRLAAALFALRREFGPRLRPDRDLLKRQLAYALPFHAAVIVEILQTNLHFYAVSWHFDAATFAIYSVGCLQVPLVDLVGGSACNVMMVRMAEERRRSGNEAVLGVWHEATAKLALVFIPMVVGLLLVGGDVMVLLFTTRYLASVPIFMVWSAGFALAALPLDGVLRVYAETRTLLLLSGMKLAVIALSIGWFMKRFGLLGAVLVTLGALTLAKSLALLRLKRILGVGAARILPWRRLAAVAGSALLAAVPALIVRAQLASTLPRLAGTSLAYGVALMAALRFFDLAGPRGSAATDHAGADRAERATCGAEG